MTTRKDTQSHASPESSLSPAGHDARVPGLRSRRLGLRGLDPKSLGNLGPGDHSDRDGLLLRVFPSGVRVWMLRYRCREGTRKSVVQRRLTLGPLGETLTLDVAAIVSVLESSEAKRAANVLVGIGHLTLASARQAAGALNGLASIGLDPLSLLEAASRRRDEERADEERRIKQGTATLGALIDRFIKARRDGEDGLEPVKRNTVSLWESLARAEIKPALGDRDPMKITRREIEEWRLSIGESGRRVWSNRCVELVRATYAWAMKKELLPSSPVVTVGSFREKPRQRFLVHDEIQKVWAALGFEPFADVFKMLLWTGARKGEVLGATWGEFDLRARVWRLPEERVKTEAARAIPLSGPVLAMLQARRDADPKGRWLFVSPVASVGALRSIQAPLRRIQARSGTSGWTPHDLRRTMKTELASLGIRGEVRDGILGHAPQGMDGVYNRFTATDAYLAEARTALEAWARRLHGIVTGEASQAAVVPFAR